MSESSSNHGFAATGAGRPRRRSIGWLLVAAGAIVAVAGLLLVNADGRREAEKATTSVTMTAVARPGVTSAQLLALEGELVGAEAVVDPETGRLPDVSAFHAKGVQSMSIHNGVLVVVMLPTASSAERERAHSRLQGSPLIERVEESAG